jgi:hypothetical protein
MTITCPVCMAPAGVPCNAPTERARRNVEWFHFKRQEAVCAPETEEAPTGGFVPPFVTDRIEGHEGDQP